MYNTVIESRPTAIMHPNPQPTNYAVHPGTTAAFAVHQEEIAPVNPTQPLVAGAYSIPVRIQGGPASDPTLSGYETPNFIHKGEKEIPGAGNNIHQNVNPKVQLQDSVKQDIEKFISQFDNSKDKADRAQVCIICFVIFSTSGQT